MGEREQDEEEEEEEEEGMNKGGTTAERNELTGRGTQKEEEGSKGAKTERDIPKIEKGGKKGTSGRGSQEEEPAGGIEKRSKR